MVCGEEEYNISVRNGCKKQERCLLNFFCHGSRFEPVIWGRGDKTMK